MITKNAIKKHRQKVGLTQSQAAKCYHRSYRQYQYWEAGYTSIPHWVKLEDMDKFKEQLDGLDA